MKFRLIQYKFFRKIYGGEYYLIRCIQLNMADFWSEQKITSCQAKIIDYEYYPE